MIVFSPDTVTDRVHSRFSGAFSPSPETPRRATAFASTSVFATAALAPVPNSTLPSTSIAAQSSHIVAMSGSGRPTLFIAWLSSANSLTSSTPSISVHPDIAR